MSMEQQSIGVGTAVKAMPERAADRGAEHLGRSDVAIILMRKLWQRELKALASARQVHRVEAAAPARNHAGRVTKRETAP